MAHTVPTNLGYVASINVTNGGTGYASNPTITIDAPTLPDGVQATATATVVNGVITNINVQEAGSGYDVNLTSIGITIGAPANGDTATATVTLGYYYGTAEPYDTKYKNLSKYSLPEFIRYDYDTFKTFVENYFDYMDQTGNPGNILFNSKYFDIDDLTAIELNKKALEIAQDFPRILAVDSKILFKHIKTLYEAKGSERAIKAYFKLVYDEDVTIEYPTTNLLRTSDGTWRQRNSVRAIEGYNGYEPTNLDSKEIDICYYSTENFYYTTPSQVSVLTGSWTSSILSTTVTAPGLNGSALTEVSIGQELRDSNGAVIGTVVSITDDDNIELDIPALINLTTATISAYTQVVRASNTIIKKIQAKVENTIKVGNTQVLNNLGAVTTPQSYELFLGNFSTAITSIPGPGDAATGTLNIEDGVLSTVIPQTATATDAGRASGLYSVSTFTTSGSGSGAIITVEVSGTGLATIPFGGLYNKGKDFAVNDTITIASADIGGGTTDLVLDVTAINDGVIKSVTMTNTGFGYIAAPVGTITDTTGTGADVVPYVENGNVLSCTINRGGSGYTNNATISFDTTGLETFIVLRDELPQQANQKAVLKRIAKSISAAVPRSGIATIDSLSAADASRAAGTYTITSSDWTSDGTGANAEFTVTIDGTGAAAVTIDTAGNDFIVGETITIADSDLGGGGADDVSFDVATHTTTDWGFKEGQSYRVKEGSTQGTIIRVQNLNNNKVPTSWTIVSPGEGWSSATVDNTLTSSIGEKVDVTVTTGYYYNYVGEFIGTRGQLSTKNVLNDNRRNQIYSYIIRSGLSQNIWNAGFRKHMHPAGKEVFGDIVSSSSILTDIRYTVPEGLSIYKFITEDFTLANDILTIRYEKVLEDTVVATELLSVTYFKDFEEEVTAEEGCSPLYVDTDYWYGSYAGSCNVYFDVVKPIEEPLTASETFVQIMTWTRSFNEPLTVTENVDIVNVIPGLTLSDSVSTSEFFEYSRTLEDIVYTDDSTDFTIGSFKNISNIVNSTEDLIINILKETNTAETATTTDVLVSVITWNRDFTDSTSGVSDAGIIIAGQNYVDPSYLATPDQYITGGTLATF